MQHFKLFKVVVTAQLVEIPYKVAFQFWTVKHRSSQMRLFDLLGFRQLSNFPHSCCNLNVIEFDCEILYLNDEIMVKLYLNDEMQIQSEFCGERK